MAMSTWISTDTNNFPELTEDNYKHYLRQLSTQTRGVNSNINIL
jgi:hypothetical protein